MPRARPLGTPLETSLVLPFTRDDLEATSFRSPTGTDRERTWPAGKWRGAVNRLAAGRRYDEFGDTAVLSAGQDGGFNPEVFVIGLDDQVYAQQFDANDNSASGYFLAQPGQVRNLQVGQDAANDPELFVTGLDDQAYGLKLNAAGSPVGGHFLMQPGVIETFTVAF
jgi:hypothetical protein